MPEPNVDAFILFNERENAVERIVGELTSRGVSTYFWRRDVPLGDDWEDLEAQRLGKARAVLVFLGAYGWGPNHLRITEEAQRLQKRIIPILIADPPEEAFLKADGLFRSRRYLTLKEPDAASLDRLAAEIRQHSSSSQHIERIVGILRDGNEADRASLWRQNQLATVDRWGLAARLQMEIRDHFGPQAESQFASAIRDPKKIASIRSWMLSALIRIDAEGEASRSLILHHLNPSWESDRNVRFWALAGLVGTSASYLKEALSTANGDDAPEVRALAAAIENPSAPEILERFRSDLASDFDTAWPVLRVLRVVPIPELAQEVCGQLSRSAPGTAFSYDSIYALSNPTMAREAARILLPEPGTGWVLERVLAEASSADRNAVRNFTPLLAAFEGIDPLLARAQREPRTREAARWLRQDLAEYREVDESREVAVVPIASDTIDVKYDPLGIKEDVQTLTAVILSRDVTPPLAIGLFGDWGTGKTHFIRSMQASAPLLARSNPAKFCSEIVCIEFNAWHYADTNLWASLVSYILEQLAAHVSPKPTPEQQQAELLSQLASAKSATQEAVAEKEQAEKQIAVSQESLTKLQQQREQKEVSLRDLRLPDLQQLLSGDAKLKGALENALQKIGVPAVVDSVSDLSQVVSEAHTVRGRAAAAFADIAKNRSVAVFLLLIGVLLFPAAWFLIGRFLDVDGLIVSVTAWVAPVVGLLGGGYEVLRRAVDVARTNLEKVESVKQKVDKLLAAKRAALTQEEITLREEIAGLKAKEQEASSRLSAATARVLDLEERIRLLKEGRSLARFLAERTHSEDYRKHLGLISTIRQDFESLAERLAGARAEAAEAGEGLRPVDRIILFIDDLDRCPADKVIDVLQAVHLLLAYPLFVVVVGVDPRWLLHSLGTTYSAFQNAGGGFSADPDLWRTTPQNYLEKIFQIPFNLSRMTDFGYETLIRDLLSSSTGQSRSQERVPDVKRPASSEDPAPPLASGGDVRSDEMGEKSVPAPESPAPAPAELALVIQEEALVIRSWEADFAARLFPLIPTPRAAKRLSNTYRILKARVHPGGLDRFEGTERLPGEFQVPLLLLAIVIGSPRESSELFPKLYRHAAGGGNAADALQRLEPSLGLGSPAFQALEEKIGPIVADAGFPEAGEIYLEWLPHVSRFSFELGRAAILPVAEPRTE